MTAHCAAHAAYDETCGGCRVTAYREARDGTAGGRCPFCDKPETAEHWRRISAGWERVAWTAAVTALIVGCGVGFAIGWAVYA